MRSVRCTRLDTAGHRGFSGAQNVPGADVWLASETSMGLEPDGWLVRRTRSRHHNKENRGASEATKRGECAKRTATEKNCQKLWKGEVLPLDRSLLMGDFSVVLLRSDFMLFSEKNRMKVHKNQWLLTMPYPLERLAGATSRGQTMAPEGQKPSKWLCLTKLPREMYSQPIVHKALSWGAIRKSACILAEITIRKSQTRSAL